MVIYGLKSIIFLLFTITYAMKNQFQNNCFGIALQTLNKKSNVFLLKYQNIKFYKLKYTLP